MADVAYVVGDHETAERLRKDVGDHCRVFTFGQAKFGYGFDVIVLLSHLCNEQEEQWFEHFKCSLRPDGRILYA